MSEGRGRPVSEAEDLSAVKAVLQGRVGSSNLAPKAVGAGTTEHESFAGAQNTQYIHLPVSSATTVVDVAHSLGQVPVGVRLYEVRNKDGGSVYAHASIVPVERDKWTESSARIHVEHLGSGSLDGCTLVLKVEGA
jgi:hypothetical protein